MKRMLFFFCLVTIMLPVLPIFAQDGFDPQAEDH
jgi:hypothetical protein